MQAASLMTRIARALMAGHYAACNARCLYLIDGDEEAEERYQPLLQYSLDSIVGGSFSLSMHVRSQEATVLRGGGVSFGLNPLHVQFSDRKGCSSMTYLSNNEWQMVKYVYSADTQVLTIERDDVEVIRCNGIKPFRPSNVTGNLTLDISTDSVHSISFGNAAKSMHAWEWNDWCFKESKHCKSNPERDSVVDKGKQAAVIENAYSFMEDMTPSISAISRVVGPTAGGTTVTIQGAFFDNSIEVNAAGHKVRAEYQDIGEYRHKHCANGMALIAAI